MTDDVFRSMKAQMEPSDQVVSDLLAVIAAEKSSPVTSANKLISLSEAAARRETSAKNEVAKAKSAKKRKPIWYYGTAVAASVLVLMSTFLAFESSGGLNNTGALKDLFLNMIHPDSSCNDPDDVVTLPSPDNDADFSLSPDETQENSESEVIGETDILSDNLTGVNVSVSGDQQISQDNSINSVPNSSDSENADNGKITPGAPGTGDISWTSEIINTDAVSSISVSGNDYVVESTVSKADVGSKIGSVTIDLPQTSSTNAATLKASVLTVNNVSTDAMVALDVKGFSQPLAYSSTEYSPATLSEFIADLDLGDDISFSSTVHCQISQVGYSAYTTYTKNIDRAVQDYLLSDGSAGRAGYSSFNSGNIKLMFVSNSNATGSKLQFGVSSNGYLYVSSSEKEYTFHIGTGSAKKFIEYVTGESLDFNGSSLKQDV